MLEGREDFAIWLNPDETFERCRGIDYKFPHEPIQNGVLCVWDTKEL
jgi:hypothetical protein